MPGRAAIVIRIGEAPISGAPLGALSPLASLMRGYQAFE